MYTQLYIEQNLPNIFNTLWKPMICKSMQQYICMYVLASVFQWGFLCSPKVLQTSAQLNHSLAQIQERFTSLTELGLGLGSGLGLGLGLGLG